jgi:hypothetical protein
VEITKLSLPNLEFQISADYDATISDQEVFSDELIVSEIIPPVMLNVSLVPTQPFPFEALLLVGGVAGVGAAAAVGVYFIRKRRAG